MAFWLIRALYMNFVSAYLSQRRLSKSFEAVKNNDIGTLLNLSPNPSQKFTYNACGVELYISLLDRAMCSHSYTCAKWLLDNGAYPYPTDSFAESLYMLERRKIDQLIVEKINFNTGASEGLATPPSSYTQSVELTLAMAFYRAQKLTPPTIDVLEVFRWTNLSPAVKQWFENQLPAYEASLALANTKKQSLDNRKMFAG